MNTQNKIEGLNVAIAQMPVQAGNPRHNANWIIKEIDQADGRGAKLIVFPELCVSGYLIGDKFQNDAFVRDVWYQNERIVSSTLGKNIVVVFGTIVTDDPDAKGEDGCLRKINGGLIAKDGQRLKNRAGFDFFAKTNLPKYRMFDEVRHMTTSQTLAEERGVQIEQFLQPFDVQIDGHDLSFGLITCEDGWIKDYLIKPPLVLANHAIDLLINVSSSPWGWQKNRARHEAFRSYLADINVPMIYANISGEQNNGKSMYGFDGASTVYNQNGEVAMTFPSFFVGVKDVILSSDMPAITISVESDTCQMWHGIEKGVEGMLATLPSRLRPVVIGLSGGLDSAVVAAVMAHIVGSENLVGICMPYRDYNSDETMEAAKFVARTLSISEFEIVPIDIPVDWQAEIHGIQSGTPEFKTVMAVQRMAVLSARAKKLGGIYTNNGNKTELAFGYLTNDADGRGAFSPLGDLLKGEVAQLAYYLNTEVYGREVIPWKLITQELPPMDELGPPESTSRVDPMDYGYVLRTGKLVRGYHDQMVHAFTGFQKDPEWFLERFLAGDLEQLLLLPEGKLGSLFDNTKEFVDDLEHWWNQFHESVWKRVQSPTNIAVSKRPFGHDFRESVMEAYYTDRYKELKKKLLS